MVVQILGLIGSALATTFHFGTSIFLIIKHLIVAIVNLFVYSGAPTLGALTHILLGIFKISANASGSIFNLVLSLFRALLHI